MPLICVVLPQKSILCCADYGSTIALDQRYQTTVREPNPASEEILSVMNK